MMKVEQMIDNNGNGAMNQFIITGDGKTVFQSYSSMIAEVDYGTKTITIGEDYNYSRTTGKHRNIFFNEYVYLQGLATLQGLNKAIKDGLYNDGFNTWTVRLA